MQQLEILADPDKVRKEKANQISRINASLLQIQKGLISVQISSALPSTQQTTDIDKVKQHWLRHDVTVAELATKSAKMEDGTPIWILYPQTDYNKALVDAVTNPSQVLTIKIKGITAI